jgi:Arc/MetJ-type ribon-helix-helix transcriptional regulator
MVLTITLPEHIQSYIDQQIADGRFETEIAVIIDVFEQVITNYRWEEDEDLPEVIAAVDRGEVVPWTDDLLDRLSEQARENSRRGHKVSDDIKY